MTADRKENEVTTKKNFERGELFKIMNIFVIVVILATICSILLMLYAINHRYSEKSYFLIFLSSANFMYNFGYLQEITSSSLETAFVSVRLQYMGLPFLLPISYLFIRDIYEQKRLSRFFLSLIFVIPIGSVLAMQAYPAFDIFYRNIEYISNGYIANCRIYPGPLYHIYTVYSYFIFMLILLIILKKSKTDTNSKIKKQQTLVLLAACMIPMVCSIVYILSPAKLRYDTTPAANTISLALLLYLIQYCNLLSVLPVARAKVIESMKDAFIVCDENFNFLDANEAAKYLFPILRSLPPGQKSSHIDQLQSTNKLKLVVNHEIHFYKTTQTLLQQDNEVNCICFVLHDVTENEKLLQELQIQASIDSLMSIYNRGAFFDLAKLMLSDATEKRIPYAMLMIDIDGFKRVNDTYGHLAGDAVLKAAAHAVKSSFSNDTDLVGRYGGEEIAILIGDISEEEIFSSAERLRHIIESTPVYYQEYTIYITVSIGIAYSPVGKNHSLENLLNQADKAMYQAKNNGRNLTMM